MSSWMWHYDTPEFSDDEPIANETETDIDTEPKEEPIMIIAMAGSSSKEETFLKETKKKLKTLMPYSGKREDLVYMIVTFLDCASYIYFRSLIFCKQSRTIPR